MGHGTAEFVTSDERLTRSIVQQLKHSTRPVLENVEVVWHFSESGQECKNFIHGLFWVLARSRMQSTKLNKTWNISSKPVRSWLIMWKQFS